MKPPDRVDRKDDNQFQRAIRITSNVKNQLFIVLGLSSAAIVTAFFGINSVVRVNYLPLADFLLGLSGNLIVALIIFLFLEQGIKSLHPISEIRNLPSSGFIENVRRVKRGDRIRILETFSSLINEHYREFEAAIKEAIKPAITFWRMFRCTGSS